MGSKNAATSYKDVVANLLPWSKRLAELLVRGSTRLATVLVRNHSTGNEGLVYAVGTPVIVIQMMST
ncbi:hypothetical protein BH11CYA1_BH11CYA1_12670 [soil metagenome]